VKKGEEVAEKEKERGDRGEVAEANETRRLASVDDVILK